MTLEFYILITQYALLFIILTATTVAIMTIAKFFLKPVEKVFTNQNEQLHNLKLKIDELELWYLQMQENNKKLKDEIQELETKKSNLILEHKGLQKLQKILDNRGKMLKQDTINHFINHLEQKEEITKTTTVEIKPILSYEN